MSFSTDPVNHDIDPNVELPSSITVANLDAIPAIVVSRNEIFINDRKIISLENGKVPEKEITQGAIQSVFRELQKLAKTNEKAVGIEGEERKQKLGTITMEMDKDHVFTTMKQVMLSAREAEFITFSLMVATED